MSRPPAPVDLESIRRLHGQGIRVRAIAAELGISRGRVARAMTRAGLPAFPVGRPWPERPPDGESPGIPQVNSPDPGKGAAP